jgi:hypothetical protein
MHAGLPLDQIQRGPEKAFQRRLADPHGFAKSHRDTGIAVEGNYVQKKGPFRRCKNWVFMIKYRSLLPFGSMGKAQ